MANIKLDMQDVMLEAQAEVVDFMREFTKELLQDDADQAVQDIWKQLPEDQKEAFKQQHPREYAEIKKKIIMKEKP